MRHYFFPGSKEDFLDYQVMEPPPLILGGTYNLT